MTSANLKPLNILLLGKEDSGKSSLGNALLGQEVFQVSSGASSATTEFQSSRSHHESGQLLQVVDSPDLMSSDRSVSPVESLTRAFQRCSSDGFHLVLLVVRLDVRFTQEERLALSCITNWLDDGLAKVGVIVFSHGDCVQNDGANFKSLVSDIRKKNEWMDDLIRRCCERYCMVDTSRGCDPERRLSQTSKLLKMVDTATVIPLKESEVTPPVRDGTPDSNSRANPTSSSMQHQQTLGRRTGALKLTLVAAVVAGVFVLNRCSHGICSKAVELVSRVLLRQMATS